MTDYDAPEDWRAWYRSTGTLAEHLAGTAPWTRHEREIAVERTAKTTSGATLAYPTMHLGRGTRWIKPAKPEPARAKQRGMFDGT